MINIWCYWSQGIENIPSFPRKCLDNWKTILPSNDFKINVIDKNIFLKKQNEISENFFDKLTYQQQSDIVRLSLLYDHGGIWIDITSILTDDLSWVIDKFNKGYEQVGFYIIYPSYKITKDVLENWFIAVKNPHNYIIFHWRKAFMRILTESIKNNNKINNSKTWKETNKVVIPNMLRTYLSMHVAHLWCIQNNKEYRQKYYKTVYLYNASNTALIDIRNPYYLKTTLTKGYGGNSNFPLIKFNKDDILLLDLLNKNKLQNLISKRLKYILNKYLK